MVTEAWLGVLLTAGGGVLAGTSAWPIKVMRRLQYEHWAMVSSLVGLLILPWLGMLLLCPNSLSVVGALPLDTWIKAIAFSSAWGAANVLCMLCLCRIGVGLAVGVLTGVGLPIGVLVPMLFKGSGLFESAPGLNSLPGAMVVIAAAMLLSGAVLAGIAGHARDRSPHRGADSGLGSRFWTGMAMACAAGVLQVGLSFSFVYTQGPIITALKEQGAGTLGANIGVWAVCLVGGGLVNVAYPLLLLIRKGAWEAFSGNPVEILLAIIMGVTFMVFVNLMGMGTIMLGPLGASVGFGVFQAFQLSGAQALGFITGEWRHAETRARRQLYIAIALLLCAVVIIAFSSSIKTES